MGLILACSVPIGLILACSVPMGLILASNAVNELAGPAQPSARPQDQMDFKLWDCHCGAVSIGWGSRH